MAKVIIFGIQDFAQLAHFYLANDSDDEITAFCVNQEYVPENKLFDGLPVVPFEDIETTHPPQEFQFFAPMSPKGMNQLRASVYGAIKSKGYKLLSYISS